MIKYSGFYYCVYFFTAQAVEILSNKQNTLGNAGDTSSQFNQLSQSTQMNFWGFSNYTKLGLISTIVIQIIHCFVTLILLLIRTEDNRTENFCRNNIWVMMRFLGLSVTLGFVFIGWRIQQSILNPLLSKKKRQSIMNRMKKSKNAYKKPVTQKLMEGHSGSDENVSSPNDERMSYVSETHHTRFASDSSEVIEFKIKQKKKQLRIMWFILMVILFICFFEMLYSGIERIANR